MWLKLIAIYIYGVMNEDFVIGNCVSCAGLQNYIQD
jgi:hypothetical protein